jgi:hypothetical protein
VDDGVEVGPGAGVVEDEGGQHRPIETAIGTDNFRPEATYHGVVAGPAGLDDFPGQDVGVDHHRAPLGQ